MFSLLATSSTQGQKTREHNIERLIEQLQDESKSLRLMAADALANLGPEAKEAESVLIQALRDEDKDVRGAAAKALWKIGPETEDAVPALIESLKEDDGTIRGMAALALGAIAKP